MRPIKMNGLILFKLAYLTFKRPLGFERHYLWFSQMMVLLVLTDIGQVMRY